MKYVAHFVSVKLLLLLGFLLYKPMLGQHVVVKSNLIGVLSGNYGGMAEVAVAKKISVLMGGNYVSNKQGDEDGFSSVTKENGYNIIPEVRFYFSNRIDGGNLQGLYIGPNLIYEKLSIDINNQSADSLNTTGKVTNLGYGLILGHQWIFSKHLAVELFFNPYINSPSVTGAVATTNPPQYEERKGIQFRRIGVALGIAF